MKYLTLLFLMACASQKAPLTGKKDELVHVSTVMKQVEFSYMKGCVEAYKDMQLGAAFPTCRERAKNHMIEIESILAQEL